MDDKHHRTIQSLQRELKTIESSDPLVKDRMNRLNDELNRTLNGDPNDNLNQGDQMIAVQKAIQEAIESFEGRHPDITEALRIAINTLVNAGI